MNMEAGCMKRKFEDTAFDNTGANPLKNFKSGSRQKTCIDNGDKLEKYLEKIYSEKCKFSISEKEVEFIRKGVERLTFECLKKVYRPAPCDDRSCKIINCCELELLKAGSIYEGTRNGFPDEFDFIAVLGIVDEEPDEWDFFHLLNKDFCMNRLVYQSKEFPDYSVEFDRTWGSKSHGKATCLKYLYKHGDKEITVDVDIVTALRCHKVEDFYTVKGIFNQDFYDEMLKTGSFLFVHNYSWSLSWRAEDDPEDLLETVNNMTWEKTVTETETRFIRDILCKTHRKAYRILKYIINGPFGEELLKYFHNDVMVLSGLIRGTSFHISSYVIKIVVIHHHYACKNTRSSVGDCVIHLLYDIIGSLKHSHGSSISIHSLLYRNEDGPHIGTGQHNFLWNILTCFKVFINRLESLKSPGNELVKCNHDLEDSFLEMVLHLDMSSSLETYLFRLDSEISKSEFDLGHLPNLKSLLKKIEDYKKKRSKVPLCPWCDYLKFQVLHKKKTKY